MLFRNVLVALAVVAMTTKCGSNEPAPLVVLIGLDGASLDIVDDLRARGRLPTFDRLIRTGASGPLQSWASQTIMHLNRRRGFLSPIVWTSIATGKIPEKHGVRDFVLPIPGTASVWMGSDEDPARARIALPEIHGRSPWTLEMRLHSFGLAGSQSAQLWWNGELLGTVQLDSDWSVISVPVASEHLQPVKNELELVFARQDRANDGTRRAAELAWLRIVDATGTQVMSLDPVLDRDRLERGFYSSRGRLTEVQSVHWRAKPFWSLLGDAGIPVGVISYWGTWPAYEVNGFLISSRMGIREQRTGSGKLTWPRELASELEPLSPVIGDLAATVERLHLSGCDPPLVDRQSVLKKILLQDEYYVRMARELLPKMESGFVAIYLRSIDVAGHATLHWRHGAAIPESCPESVRDVMDEIYGQIDLWINEVLEALPRRATVVVVSDHGMQPIEGGGHHAPFGLFIAQGEGLRRGKTFHGSTVLDVAPTILHPLGAEVPLDMDGKVLAPIYESVWLARNAPRYADIDTTLESETDVETEASEDALEQLRALGYIE